MANYILESSEVALEVLLRDLNTQNFWKLKLLWNVIVEPFLTFWKANFIKLEKWQTAFWKAQKLL